MTAKTWKQVNIGFPDPAHAEHTVVTQIAPLLTRAEEAGRINAWFFVRKGPWWRVRYLPTGDGSAAQADLRAHLDAVHMAGRCTAVVDVVYEPEIRAFGGAAAMDVAHRFWHLDSRHVLTYLAAVAEPPSTGRQREISLLLCTALLRAAGLDWYEQGDVWGRVADHRDPPASSDHIAALLRPARRLMSVTPRTATHPNGTPVVAGPWCDAYTTTGRTLADLAATGHLRRGLRDVLAHHIIFAWNRLGLPGTDQSTLATAAHTVVFGTDPAQPSHTTPAQPSAAARTPGGQRR